MHQNGLYNNNVSSTRAASLGKAAQPFAAGKIGGSRGAEWLGAFWPTWNASTHEGEEVVLAPGRMQTHMMLPAEPPHFQWCGVVVVVGVDSRFAADLAAALDQFSGGQRPLDRQVGKILLRVLPPPIGLPCIGPQTQVAHGFIKASLAAAGNV